MQMIEQIRRKLHRRRRGMRVRKRWEAGKQNGKELCESLLCAAVIGIVAEWVTAWPVLVVLTLSVIGWLWILLLYGKRKNLRFIEKCICLQLGLLIGYVGIQLIMGHGGRYPTQTEDILGGALTGLMLLIPVWDVAHRLRDRWHARLQVHRAKRQRNVKQKEIMLLEQGEKEPENSIPKDSEKVKATTLEKGENHPENSISNDKEKVETVCLEKKEDSSENDLYKERKHDKKRILNYLQTAEMLGVNAAWGMGKSFLIEYLKREPKVQEEYEVIQIDLLSCDLDEIEKILVDEIGKIFRKYRIYPEKSFGLKAMLGKNQWTDTIRKEILRESESMAASFASYKKELYKIPKKILLVYEDIDRIGKKKTIKKIFAISEKLAGERLHVIYQYDAQEMEALDFDRDYLEKYIPYTVNLTPIRLERLIDLQWDSMKMPKQLEKNAVRFLRMHVTNAYQLKRLLGVDMTFELELPVVTIRKVRIYLQEIKILIEENPEYQKKENIETLVHVLFLKHFYEPYYKKLQIGLRPLEQLKFTWNGELLTITQILKQFHPGSSRYQEKPEERIRDLNALIQSEENRHALTILLILGYTLWIEPEQKVDGVEPDIPAHRHARQPAHLQDDRMEKHQKSEQTNSPLDIRQREQQWHRMEKNDKIDRILWNILGNGTSEMTDAENAAKMILRDVACHKGAECKKAWDAFQRNMFHGEMEKDNDSIYKVGDGMYLPLFKAMKLYTKRTEDWHAFLDFYFWAYQEEEQERQREASENITGVNIPISEELIRCLEQCELQNKNILMQIIRFFNELKVSYNLNEQASYRHFFEKYMGAICNLGYVKRMEYWMFAISSSFAEHQEMVLNELKELEKELQEQREKYMAVNNGHALGCVTAEYDLCLAFVRKNKELIQCEAPMPDKAARRHGAITKWSSRWIHQEEVDRLKALKKQAQQGEADEQVFWDEVTDSYEAGRIYLPECDAVLKEDKPVEE